MEVMVMTESGERKAHHIPEMTSIVGCSQCGHMFRACDTKATMVKSTQTRRFVKYHNPDWVSDEIALISTEDGVIKVRQSPENPRVKKWLWKKVELRAVEFTCQDCLDHPIYHSVVDRNAVTPSVVLDIADEIRDLREEHGARLIMLGHGRKVDKAVDMVCCKLGVKFQEA